MTALLLTVDPASTSGWAVWRDGRLVRFGSVRIAARPPLPTAPAMIIGDWWEDTIQHVNRDAHLVLESHGHRNRNTQQVLDELRTRWIAVAELRGWTHESVNNATWQRVLLGAGKSADLKAAARLVAEARIAKDGATGTLDEDAADAIALGCYWLHPLTRAQRGAKEMRR